jgi:PhnB protein
MVMSQAGPVNPAPPNIPHVTPRLVVRNAALAVDFYVRAFGAKEISDRFIGEEGALVHAEVQIGDSTVRITEKDGPIIFPDQLDGMATCLMCLQWADVDEAWEQAVNAGAEVIYPVEDQIYGEREGRLRDPFGHQWMMSQHIEELTSGEIQSRMDHLHAIGAAVACP